MSIVFRQQPFVAVSGNRGGKVPVVDEILLSQEQEIYPTTSLNENCTEFEFQIDRTYYVDLGQTYLASKRKSVKSRGNKNSQYQSSKKEAQRKGSSKCRNNGGGGGARGSISFRYSCKQHFALNFFQC